MIHTQLLKSDTLIPVTFKFFIGPILASLFIFTLFPFSIKLIVSNEDSFGYDDTSFKRKLLFGLMALQFVPVMLSIGFMAATDVPDDKANGLLIEQLLANLLFLTAAMILKFGNYLRDDGDEY